MTDEIIQLETWNPETTLCNKFFSMCITGSRREGKSYMIRHLYYVCKFHYEYDFVVVFSENSDNLDFYSNFVHGSLFFDHYDSDVIERLKKLNEAYEMKGITKKFLIIMDDCMSNSKNEENFKRLYAQGRHLNMSIIFSIQKTTLIDTTARNNSDVVLVCRSKSAMEKTSIIDNFMKGTADEEDMGGLREDKFHRKLMKEYCRDYQFLVLDYMNSDSNEFKDIVKKYKAD
jgi:hypothetical protein